MRLLIDTIVALFFEMLVFMALSLASKVLAWFLLCAIVTVLSFELSPVAPLRNRFIRHAH